MTGLKFQNYSMVLISAVLITLAGCNGATNDKGESELTVAKQSQVTLDAFKQEVVLKTLVSPQVNEINPNLKLDSVTNKMQGDTYQLVFSQAASIPTARFEPAKPWDLSALAPHNLAFDVTIHTQDSVQLYLSVENPDGKIQSRSISLLPGYDGTVYFPLSGIEAETEAGFWGDVPPWETQDSFMIWRSWRASQVDVSKIAALNFFVIGPMSDKSLSIGNVRIRQNPPTREDWLNGVVDKFGQNAKRDFPIKVDSEYELAALANLELESLANSKGAPKRSKYGGYTGAAKRKATGFFRVEKVDGKWWMIDPEGHLFFSHGPANVRMSNMTTLTGVDFKDPSVRVRHPSEVTPEDSMGIVSVSDEVRATRYVAAPIRHNLFNWLPDYDDPLADHYSYRRSTHKGAMSHGETYSFYRANLERRYGETYPQSYIDKWHEVTVDRMQDWGFTSFGNWVDPAFYEMEKVPYFANGWIIGDFQTLSGYKNHWGLMPDPFDPVFAERAKYTIDVIAKEVKGSPWCAGIFIDNEKSWGEREGSVPQRYGVVLDALSKSSQKSYAKAAFSAQIQQKYGSIEALNESWQTDISSWSAFEQGIALTDFNDEAVADLSMLLERLGEQYFTVVHNTLEKVLPNHLYMGARMANWGMPDEIIKASLKYSDVLSFNIYEEGVQDHAWDFLEDVDLPVVIGEFHIGSATDSGMFNPGIVHAANQQDRARMYKAYMDSVLSKNYMVGAHWFQYIDEPLTGRAFDGENANIGLVTTTDIPYPELIEAVKKVTGDMYQKRLEQRN
ncbi:MAG: beta-galactosidase [Aliiglaciecola sp.]